MPVPSLPGCGTLRLEIICTGEQFLGNINLGTIFGFILTETLQHGFCDEWLVGSKNCNRIDEQPDLEAYLNNKLKLHISCSFDLELVMARQRGLWPSCAVEPPCAPRDSVSCDIKVSKLMPKSSLVYRQRLQQSAVQSLGMVRRESAQPSHCHAIKGWRDSPVYDMDTNSASASSRSQPSRTSSPQRDRRPRQRPQRRHSEMTGAAGCYAFAYEHERPHSTERPPSAESPWADAAAPAVCDPRRF